MFNVTVIQCSQTSFVVVVVVFQMCKFIFPQPLTMHRKSEQYFEDNTQLSILFVIFDHERKKKKTNLNYLLIS